MAVVIFLRNTEDWGNITIDDILHRRTKHVEDNDIHQESIDKAYPRWKEWEKKFSFDFLEYRRRIKQIAMDNWGDRKVYVEDWKRLIQEVEDDDIVVPIDDDDWLHPQLEAYLYPHFEHFDCVMWDQVTYNTRDFGARRRHEYHDKLGSNNYALTGRLLRQAEALYSHRMYAKKFLKFHGRVTYALSAMQCNYMVLNSPLLSCYNWHIGSASVLVNVGVTVSKPKYLTLDEECQWIEPWMNQFNSCLFDLFYKIY